MLWNSFVLKISAGVFLAAVAFAPAVGADTTYLDLSRTVFQRPDANTQMQLIDCFMTGNCVNDDKVRIYPMPCEGSGGADCTGCYRLQGGVPIRIDDLNSSGTCAGVGRADEQKLRVFVGYERSCPGGAATCTDGQLLLGCSVMSEGVAGVGDSLLSYNKDCFSGRSYVRRAHGVMATFTALPSPGPIGAPTGDPGCPAGKTGIYPYCISCSDTSYKPTPGPNACTACVLPVIANSESVIVSTAGTTKTSVNDCRVNFTCNAGYTENLETQTCDQAVNTPLPSSTPAPSSNPSPSPSHVPTCADANMTLVVRSTNLYGTTGSNYILDFLQTWDKRVMNKNIDYRAIVFSRMDGGYISGSKILVSAQGTAASNFIPVTAGSYRAVTFYSVQGMRCPELAPIYFTVPLSGGGG